MAIVDGHIRCSDCKELRSLETFPKSAVKRGYGICRACASKRSALSRAEDPDRVNARSRQWYRNNRDRHLARTQDYYRRNEPRAHGRHLMRTYGISGDEYEALLLAQGGGCAICGKSQGTEKNRLAVDHDHVTDRVRGLLCHRCNRALGAFGDSIDGIRRVLAYLERASVNRADPSMRINLLGAN